MHVPSIYKPSFDGFMKSKFMKTINVHQFASCWSICPSFSCHFFHQTKKSPFQVSVSTERVPLSRGWSARSTGQRGVRHPKISLKMEVIYGDFLKWGYPIAGWFFMDNPMKKWRIWGYHHFRKPYINIYLYIIIYIYIYIHMYSIFNISPVYH